MGKKEIINCDLSPPIGQGTCLPLMIYQPVIRNRVFITTQHRQPGIMMLIPLHYSKYTHRKQHHYSQEQPDAEMFFHFCTVAAWAALSPIIIVFTGSVFNEVLTGAGLSGVNCGAPGPGFLVASRKAGTYAITSTMAIVTSHGLKESNSGMRLSSCRFSLTGNSSMAASVCFFSMVPKNTTRNSMPAMNMIIQPSKASVVEGTHSGVNNSLLGFSRVIAMLVR